MPSSRLKGATMYDRNLLKDIAFLEKMLTEPNITDNYSLK